MKAGKKIAGQTNHTEPKYPKSKQTETSVLAPTPWQRVFRKGFAPQFSTHSLQELLRALENDDVRLLQGATTSPPPLMVLQDWPVEACCAVTFCGLADGLETVGECEEYFARACHQCDQLLGEPAGCRFLLNWFDDTPRLECFEALAQECRRELSIRVAVKQSTGRLS